ncbi:MAG: hypothetical protein K2H84_01715, partial [Paramuribaculum sp.]|nr:hypothetical protein [Paramuribaculum sp.]
FNASEGIDFDRLDAPEIPVFSPNAQATHQVELDPSYNPFVGSDSSPSRKFSTAYRQNDALKAAGSDWNRLYEDFASETVRSSAMQASALNNITIDEEEQDMQEGIFETPAEQIPATNCIQVKSRFIMSPSRSGVMVIDQHRAHLKVLYEKYISQISQGSFGSQRLLFPEVVTLSTTQSSVMDTLLPVLTDLGFDLAFLGDNSWSINGAPTIDTSPVDTLLKIIEEEIEGGETAETALKNRAALAMAKAAAVKYGQTLTAVEMERLLSDLFKLTTPNFTPDGKLIVSVITTEELSKLFS